MEDPLQCLALSPGTELNGNQRINFVLNTGRNSLYSIPEECFPPAVPGQGAKKMKLERLEEELGERKLEITITSNPWETL